jgi:predicted ArsR family transcriptional regulator
MHDRRRAALDALRMHGGLTIDELARTLRIARTASANHLARLRADGMVAPQGLRQGKRRPSVVYGLTPAADRHFHQEYETFAVELLDEIERGSPRQLERLMRRVGDRWVARDLPLVLGLRGQARSARALEIVSSRGFMPTYERKPRGFVLRNHNCPIAQICRAQGDAISMVRRWLGALLDVRLRNTACICRGAPACEYIYDG